MGVMHTRTSLTLRPRKGTHGFETVLQPLIGPWCRFVQVRMGAMQQGDTDRLNQD
jgi:hypothetical protein